MAFPSLSILKVAVVLNSFVLKKAILRELKNYFRESFANPTVIFRGGLMLKSSRKNTFAMQKKSPGQMLKPGNLGNKKPGHGPVERLPVV